MRRVARRARHPIVFSPVTSMTDSPPKNVFRGYTDEALENMRYRYVETDEPIASIAASFSRNRDTITRIAKRYGWTMRRDRPLRELPAALRGTTPAADAGAATPDPGDTALDVPDDPAIAALPMALRLEQAVVRELRKVERRRNDAGGVRPAEAERVARTLSTLTQTLAKVRALRDGGADGDDHDRSDDMPADLDDFRRELARRIDAFVASRNDEGLCAADESANAAPPVA
jgi:hypothetical protein